MTPPAIHAIPLERDPDGRGHTPFVACWCGPIDGFRDIATTAPVYVHRNPPQTAASPGATPRQGREAAR